MDALFSTQRFIQEDVSTLSSGLNKGHCECINGISLATLIALYLVRQIEPHNVKNYKRTLSNKLHSQILCYANFDLHKTGKCLKKCYEQTIIQKR